MEIWQYVLIGALALTVLVMAGYLLSLHRALCEVAQELEEKLHTDTNTCISISTGDRAVRALAVRINTQLQALRGERLRLRHGDAGLKAAITNVSHDLRTPLTAICGYLDLLEQEPHSDASQRYLAIIRERANAMRSLSEELFQYSVILSKAEELTPEPVSLNGALEQSLAGFYSVFSARGIRPDIHLPACTVMRVLDSAALRRVFDNILSNAAKYSAGDLAVTLMSDGEITFANHAQNLSRVQANQLFDRFFTVETASGSTGLGLSIAKLLTEKMGGRIAAELRDGNLCIRTSFPE